MKVYSQRWHQLKWGDIATLEYGKGLRGYQTAQSKYPVYGTNGLIGWHDTALCKKPGIIIGRKGAYRGVHLSKTPFFVIDTAFYLNLLSDGIDLIWAYYQLINFDINKIDSGSAIPSTSREAFYQIPVLLPPLPTQRKIAAILSAYDDLIENNTRRIAILEEMAQSLYREWFVHFRFPGHEKIRMVESVLGMIPEGWEVKAFSEVAELERNGINPSRFEHDTFEHYSIPAFDEGCMPIMNVGGEIKSNKFLVPQGSILLSKINPRIPRVWLPIVASSRCAVASTEFLVLIPKPPWSREFLFSYCKSTEFIDRFASRAGGTSTSHQRVKPEDFKKLLIVQPEKTFLNIFTNAVVPMFQNVHNLRLRNAHLSKTRNLLLPKLISGEVDVEGLEIAVGEERE